jgi:2-hydroxy-6-oxonona-2,4-dienedioate hydrolase
VDGLRVHYRASERVATGGRPVVILVHGLIVSGRYMVPTLKQLTRHYRVYAPDLPGFGKSESPPAVLGIPGLSGALSAWMDAVGLKGATLIGNSMGCQVIAHLAARRPELVEQIVLQAPTMDPHGRSVRRHVARFLLDVPREPRPSRPSSYATSWQRAHGGVGARSATGWRTASRRISLACGRRRSSCAVRGIPSVPSAGPKRRHGFSRRAAS